MVTENKVFKSVDIARHPEATIILPEGMSLMDGSKWLRSIDKELSEPMGVFEKTSAHPLDGAHALAVAISRKYGHARSVPTKSFFGDIPPTMIDVPINANGESVKVPWGHIVLPGMDDSWISTGVDIENGRQVFVMRGEVLKRYAPDIAELASLMRQVLAEESIYRGKAFRVQRFEVDDDSRGNPTHGAPQFIDLSDARLENVILNAPTQAQLEDYVLAPIRWPAAAASIGVRRKRGVLLHGPYGTGKSMTAKVIANEATTNGMTFIYLEDPRLLAEGFRFAMEYQPAVLFVEDVDKVTSGERTDDMNRLLNIMDGIDSKTAEIITVFTTNEIDSIHKAFDRPGRIDVMIEFAHPDANAAARLVAHYAGETLSPDASLDVIGTALAGSSPALIAEAVHRSKLSALTRAAGMVSGVRIETDDVVLASQSLETARRLLSDASAPTESTLERMGRAAFREIHGAVNGNGN